MASSTKVINLFTVADFLEKDYNIVNASRNITQIFDTIVYDFTDQVDINKVKSAYSLPSISLASDMINIIKERTEDLIAMFTLARKAQQKTYHQKDLVSRAKQIIKDNGGKELVKKLYFDNPFAFKNEFCDSDIHIQEAVKLELRRQHCPNDFTFGTELLVAAGKDFDAIAIFRLRMNEFAHMSRLDDWLKKNNYVMVSVLERREVFVPILYKESDRQNEIMAEEKRLTPFGDCDNILTTHEPDLRKKFRTKIW